MAGIPERSSSRSGRNRGAAAEADAIGEQQLKRTQSGSSRRSAHHRGAELKRTQSGSSSRSGHNRGAAALHHPAPDYSRRRMRGEVAERAKRAKLLVQMKRFHKTSESLVTTNPTDSYYGIHSY